MLVVVEVRRILERPRLSPECERDDAMVRPGRMVHVTAISYVLDGEEPFRIIRLRCGWDKARAISRGSFSGFDKLMVMSSVP